MIDDVVRRCQKGDEDAFHELFRLHGGMVQKIAMRMTRNTEWQRDIFQDVVEQVINKIATFRGECKFTTWLYRVAVNAALRFLQSEGTYKKMLSIDDETAMDHTAKEGGALSFVEQKEMFGHTMAALMTLPRVYKDVLSLYYFGERKIEEIADSTGKSNGAIKSGTMEGSPRYYQKTEEKGIIKTIMRCSRVEKNLYLLSEGLADQKLEADISEHLRSCKRCGRFLADLQAMNKILTEGPDAALIPPNEVDEMVTASLRRRRRPLPQKSNRFRLYGMSVPKVAMAYAALLSVVAIGLFSALFLYRTNFPQHNSVAAVGAQDGRRVVVASRDSALFLGQNCTAYLHKGSTCAILRAEETVVIIDLENGELLLAANKGMYDTIAVRSGTAQVYATGTHFEVDRSCNILNVSVLEGKVKVLYAGEKETPVSALETWTLNTKENTSKTERLSLDKQRQMIYEFGAVAAANTRIGLTNALSGKNIDNNAISDRSKFTYMQRQNQNAANDSAAIRQYSIAEKMIQNGKYASAAVVLEDYLKKYKSNSDSAWFDLAFCYTNLRRYNDAIDTYLRVVDAGVDEQLVETALHRSNKILFVKLKEYDEARCGIVGYLKKYPRGRWREEEFYYCIQIDLAQGKANRADSLTKVFASEFPGNCRTHELLEKVEASRR